MLDEFRTIANYMEYNDFEPFKIIIWTFYWYMEPLKFVKLEISVVQNL